MSESHPETSRSRMPSTNPTSSNMSSDPTSPDTMAEDQTPHTVQEITVTDALSTHVTAERIISKDSESKDSESSDESVADGASAISPFWRRNRWLIPVLPLLIYLLCGWFEPTRTQPVEGSWFAMGLIPFDYYPAYYFFRMAFTLLALLCVLPGVRSHAAGDWFTFRWHGFSLLLGVIGAIIWVGLCQIPWNAWCIRAATWLGQGDAANGLFGSAARVGFNPWSDLEATPGTLSLVIFLVVRFVGLAIVVPFAEELFLRGFLLRFVQQERWWTVPIGALTQLAIATLLVYAVVTHPSEWVAAIVWFSAVTWWTARTQNLWYAVQVHMTTNLGLGLWILWSRQWWLW